MPKPTDEQRAEGRWFFAFSDPTRLAILRALAGGSRTAKELSEAVGLKALGAGIHLNKLKRAGLIVSSRDGVSRRCELVSAKVTRTAIEFTHPSGRAAVIPRS